MVLEVVQHSELVGNEVKVQDAVLEFLVFTELSALVTAASEEGVEDENWDAGQDKNGVLKHVDDQVDVKAGRVRDGKDTGKLPKLEFELFVILVHVLHEVDGVAHDSGLD